MAKRGLPVVKLYKPQAKQITEAHVVAAKKTAAKLRTLIIKDQVIPFETGTLQNVLTDVDLSQAEKGTVAIVHDGPYAQRLYYNPQYDFRTTYNPNARGEWWEPYLEGAKKDYARKSFLFYYKKEAGI